MALLTSALLPSPTEVAMQSHSHNIIIGYVMHVLLLLSL